MKRVLILAYDFPPYVSVGGLRPYNWYAYLKEYGVEPIVVTRQYDIKFGDQRDYISASQARTTHHEQTEKGQLYRTVYTPNLANKLLLNYGEKRFSFIRKAITAFYEIGQFLWISGPRKELYLTAKKVLKEHKVDAIIATGTPFVLFKYAHLLSKEFDIPWIADYRDSWTNSLVARGGKFFRWFNRWNERRIVGTASRITTVSDTLKELLQNQFPSKQMEVMENGFDPHAVNKVASIKQERNQLTISLAGSIYDWHPWKEFFSVIQEVIEEHQIAIHLKFYGTPSSDSIRNYLLEKHPSLVNYCHFLGRMPNDEVLKELAKDNVLLLFNEFHIYGTKIFDYVGLKRKILFCFSQASNHDRIQTQYFPMFSEQDGKRNLQIEILNKTNSGIIVKDHLHLKVVLIELLAEFNEHGEIACHSKNIEQYSRKIQVEKLSRIIVELSES